MTNPFRKYAVELIGTFFLVFTIGQTVIDGAPGVIPPIAIGSALMVMIYAGGHISGAHYNPAVTLAVLIRGRIPGRDVLPYMIAQVLGAVLAAFVTIYLKGHGSNSDAGPPHDPVKSFLVEALFTFALGYVVLNVATAKANAVNSFYGLAIGFTVLVGAFSVGAISGGAFNPAVAVGVTLMGLASLPHLAILLAGTFTGGALAGLTFNLLNPDDR